MNSFEARVVINQYQQVLIPGMLRPHEGSRDVCVDQATRERGFIAYGDVRSFRCVGFSTSRTSLEVPLGERTGGVGCD
eukprot:5352386-Pleurochrysis_carterae.AAC.1